MQGKMGNCTASIYTDKLAFYIHREWYFIEMPNRLRMAKLNTPHIKGIQTRLISSKKTAIDTFRLSAMASA
ncbi:MAG: hypothetical protein JSS64_01845 [Bacteroidetes bacterium]|nr:hypothetical protein [Bacteroidota bacterium]